MATQRNLKKRREMKVKWQRKKIMAEKQSVSA